VPWPYSDLRKSLLVDLCLVKFSELTALQAASEAVFLADYWLTLLFFPSQV
jgi:hypothetical protein